MDKNGFLIDLSASERTDFGRVDFDEQPEAQRVFSAIWELESQVNFGGFHQNFQHSESCVISDAPTALRTIGAASCARIVERAIKIIAPLPPTRDGRYRVLDALIDIGQRRLAILDSEFLAYPDDLTDLLFEYVAHYPEAFGPVPFDVVP